MPQYVYRAVTNRGLVVKNKVEESSRQSLIRRLKNNGLTPIQIVQVSYKGVKTKKQKKNVHDIQDIMKVANSTNIANNNVSRKPTFVENLNLKFASTEKVTSRDLVIFTQNFYLLKKANFNNIHALQTIVQSTENLTLKGIIEDILAGVEGRRLYVYNYGILF